MTTQDDRSHLLHLEPRLFRHLTPGGRRSGFPIPDPASWSEPPAASFGAGRIAGSEEQDPASVISKQDPCRVPLVHNSISRRPPSRPVRSCVASR